MATLKLAELPDELKMKILTGLNRVDLSNIFKTHPSFNNLKVEKGLWFNPEDYPEGTNELFNYAQRLFPRMDERELWYYLSEGQAFKGAEFLFGWKRCFLQAGRQNRLDLFNYFMKIFDTESGFEFTLKGLIEKKNWELAELIYEEYIERTNAWHPTDILFGLGLGGIDKDDVNIPQSLTDSWKKK